MKPAEIKASRKRLGLTQSGLADALRMGANGGRTVRRWEGGEMPITGPAAVAIEMLVQAKESGK